MSNEENLAHQRLARRTDLVAHESKENSPELHDQKSKASVFILPAGFKRGRVN
jgi:hypothetical protein